MRALNFPGQILEIREVVAEASQALARLDADRLEELALACLALNRDRRLQASPNVLAPDAETEAIPPRNLGDGQRTDQALARQVRETAGDIRTFGRVLEATRANLVVMRRLRQLREGKIEYSEAQARGWAPPEPGYGDN
jgi:hypothetical protein